MQLYAVAASCEYEAVRAGFVAGAGELCLGSDAALVSQCLQQTAAGRHRKTAEHLDSMNVLDTETALGLAASASQQQHSQRGCSSGSVARPQGAGRDAYHCADCGARFSSADTTMRGVLCQGTGCQRWHHLYGCQVAAGADPGSTARSRRAPQQLLCGLCSTAAGQAAAAAVLAPADQDQEAGSSDDEMAAAAEAALRKRRRPAWADGRPGCWLLGAGADDFFVQRGDFVFMEAAAADPLAFIVSSSSSGARGDAYVALFKVVEVAREALQVGFFCNEQRSLREPLRYQGDGVQQQLAQSSVSGKVLHALEPDSPDEVLGQLLSECGGCC